MTKGSVLFVCVHNTARSPMAEALLKERCGSAFDVQSAGITAGELNPAAVEAMQEIGIDISEHTTKAVIDLYRQGAKFQYVINLCNEAAGERCPIVPGVTRRLDWSCEDPSAVSGGWEERLAAMRAARDAIQAKIAEWCSRECPEVAHAAGATPSV